MDKRPDRPSHSDARAHKQNSMGFFVEKNIDFPGFYESVVDRRTDRRTDWLQNYNNSIRYYFNTREDIKNFMDFFVAKHRFLPVFTRAQLTDGQSDGWTDGRTNGRTDERIDGQTNGGALLNSQAQEVFINMLNHAYRFSDWFQLLYPS